MGEEATPPVPVAPHLFAIGSEGLVSGEAAQLAAPVCGTCGLATFPARRNCERCGSVPLEMALTNGVLRYRTEVLHPPPDGRVPVPYAIGFVEFPVGLSVLGLLDETGERRIGPAGPVEVVAYEAFPGVLTYAFRSAGAHLAPVEEQ